VWTAAPAGIGLRVEAAIERIVVFGLALRAHRKYSHRGLRTVVGDPPSDGEAWPAVGAIKKWITVPAIGGVEEFAEAIGTGSGISRNAGAYVPVSLAGDDAEGNLASRCKVREQNGIDPRQRWRFGVETADERSDAELSTLKLDDHSIGVVTNEAGKMFFGCEAINERSKADTLNHASDPDNLANSFRLRVQGCG